MSDYALSFAELANRFRDFKTDMAASAEQHTAWHVDASSAEDEAGRLIAEAFHSGVLHFPRLAEYVAWIEGGPAPEGTPATLAPVPANLFGFAVRSLKASDGVRLFDAGLHAPEPERIEFDRRWKMRSLSRQAETLDRLAKLADTKTEEAARSVPEVSVAMVEKGLGINRATAYRNFTVNKGKISGAEFVNAYIQTQTVKTDRQKDAEALAIVTEGKTATKEVWRCTQCNWEGDFRDDEKCPKCSAEIGVIPPRKRR